jgi:hypothetical protein
VPAKKNGLHKGGRSIRSVPSALALDDDPAVTIIVTVAIAASPDHHCIVAISILTLADHFAVAVAVAMTGANGNAGASRAHTHTDADIFRTRRHRNGNSGHRDGSHYKTLDHRMLLSTNLPGSNSRECELFRHRKNRQIRSRDRRGNVGQPCTLSQSDTAMKTSRITAKAGGVIFFELPLRGESLAA